MGTRFISPILSRAKNETRRLVSAVATLETCKMPIRSASTRCLRGYEVVLYIVNRVGRTKKVAHRSRTEPMGHSQALL